MREALDQFELEGIGHNLPFLSAVMDHPKFCSGDMTTAFIAEEYPDGFEGAEIAEDDAKLIAAATAVLNMISELRRTRLSGALANHKRKVAKEWVAVIDGHQLPLGLRKLRNEGATVKFGREKVEVETEWRPGNSLARVKVGDRELALKVEPTHTGFRIRWRGADKDVKLISKRQAQYLSLMPTKVPPDYVQPSSLPDARLGCVHRCQRGRRGSGRPAASDRRSHENGKHSSCREERGHYAHSCQTGR